MAHAIETYLEEVAAIHASDAAVGELAYYGALSRLLSDVGSSLEPHVRCVMSLRDLGAGFPDGGLFTADQFDHDGDAPGERPQGKPSRGAIEAKATDRDIWPVIGSDQVRRYAAEYGRVLVTNFWEFVLVVPGADGAPPVALESFSFADDETAFWRAAEHPRVAARRVGDDAVAYLARVMSADARITEPRDVAAILARYARVARARIEHDGSLPGLDDFRATMSYALGASFTGERGERFFRSAVVQSLFYAVFSAWVLWTRDQRPGSKALFNWREAAWFMRLPLLEAFFEHLASPRRIGPLAEVLDWAGAALNRVDAPSFFSRFDSEHAVQYFYEPFLAAFDPDLRKDYGVWYTPTEVVSYMVARVDAALREELGIEDGLADEAVLVLDPCCGTGAYLIEVLRAVHERVKDRRGAVLAAETVRKAACERVFGFEILPAPYVIAHLQVDLFLRSLGASFRPPAGKDTERAAVYLTNALTGWSPPAEDGKKDLDSKANYWVIPEALAEVAAAERVKHRRRVLVVLGNPPYDGFAGMAVREERELTEPYRTTRRAPAPQGQGLNDLFVRFYGLADRRIVKLSQEGVVCFISNYSWLDGLSYTGMRERYLEAFDRVWIDCLNGDKYKTGKMTPDGEPDPSVFSTEFNREGIQVGTAVATMVRRAGHEGEAEVRFRHLWGKQKRTELLASAGHDGISLYESLSLPAELGFPFFPCSVGTDYLTWPRLPDLFPRSFPGVKTSRDDFVVDVDRDVLAARVQRYLDRKTSNHEIQRDFPGVMESTKRFDAVKVREYLRTHSAFRPERIVRYCYRPFDLRWVYWELETKLLDEKRAEYVPHVFPGNLWIEARQKQPKDAFDRGLPVRVLADNFGNGLSSFFPLFVKSGAVDGRLHAPGEAVTPVPNLTDGARDYLASLSAEPANLFHHVLAVLHSPAYRLDNAGALRQDWPRVPLPATVDALKASATIGQALAALFDPETPVSGVTRGKLRPELIPIAVLTVEPDKDGKAGSMDWTVDAGWGYRANGAVMPGGGQVVRRPITLEERASVEAGAASLGMSVDKALSDLGDTTLDIYMNGEAAWRNVPERVWTYTLGGYAVLKKWLSYRETSVLGRKLRPDEAEHFTDTARRIAAVLLMADRLDDNYRAVIKDIHPFESGTVRRARGGALPGETGTLL